jgi:hypothetical protein
VLFLAASNPVLYWSQVSESIDRGCINDFFRQSVPSINSPHCTRVTPQSGATAKFLQFTTVSPRLYTALICLDEESAAAVNVHIMQVLLSFSGISAKTSVHQG